MPKDAALVSWGPKMHGAGVKSGKPFDTASTMKAAIEAAEFVNVREKEYKVPIGEWTKNACLKEAGKSNRVQILDGLEGYAM